MTAPLHLLLGPVGHGVRRCAADLARAVGAATATDPRSLADGDPVHLHLTDRVVASDPASAADRVEAWAARCPLTVTLHDVPQPTDGAAFAARRAAYARIVRAVDGWAVCSEHERELVHDLLDGATGRPGRVLPLPLEPAPAARLPAPARLPAGRTVVLLGWLYPGKGHAEVVRALASLPPSARGPAPLTVVSAGAVSPGHDDLVAALGEEALVAGLGFQVTGWLGEDEALAWLQHADVPVAGHRNVSASASVNSWVAAGRRPLVRRSRYAEEVERLRPGCHVLWRDEELADRLAAALADPALTRLAGPPPGPDLATVAAAYVAWWRSLDRARSGAA
ncbi:hypothetical protein [Nocardioides perillae]|uniref:Glycosyltransferase involved in cell wall biosynthesis n=1 Tax=Nocardioides perillae TaxID=1119534 RepID=A0A7Y9RSW0_9ACTN|nr:hypothetical protein [Nocardioides perillae]NYG54616.1 glycosyltransferase involved in cell wall biosynthesis [Nocardioides perillae]